MFGRSLPWNFLTCCPMEGIRYPCPHSVDCECGTSAESKVAPGNCQMGGAYSVCQISVTGEAPGWEVQVQLPRWLDSSTDLGGKMSFLRRKWHLSWAAHSGCLGLREPQKSSVGISMCEVSYRQEAGIRNGQGGLGLKGKYAVYMSPEY
jgi:hypothetical protein